jgi:hypothetical protein
VNRASALSAPHALRHEAVLSRTVKRLAVGAHRLASAGVSLAFLHKAHLSRAVKRLAVRAHRLAVAGLRRSRADREAGNQRCQDNASHKLVIHLQRAGLPCGRDRGFRPRPDSFTKGLKTGHCH